jgi:tRNA(Ile)-lysidine synthase
VLEPGTTPWPCAGVAVRVRASADVDASDVERTQLGLPLALPTLPRRPRIPPAAVVPGGSAARSWLALPEPHGPLVLRARRPGDRIRTSGGTRRVAEVFAEAGVPRPVRERWPLVTLDGRVLWVPGLAADASVAAVGRAQPSVVLHLVAMSGPGRAG